MTANAPVEVGILIAEVLEESEHCGAPVVRTRKVL